jgi:choline monooxygenase
MAPRPPWPRFEVDADVARARTLPPAFYLDAEVYAAVREAVFARAWHWIGTLDEVREPGSLAPRTLLPGSLDEPLLLARDGAGTLRCLSNVCTHRGMPLVDAPCRRPDIRCAYHSRRFDLAGRMTFMPGFDGAAGFPSAADDLPQVALGTWGGHAFAALRPAVDFERWIAPVASRLGGLALDRFVHAPERDRDFVVQAHWALYVENYLEGLHIPFLHPGLNQALDLSGYRYELFEGGNLQVGLGRPGEPAFEPPPAGLPDGGERVAALYLWLFPHLMLNVYPWGLSLNLVQPLAPDRTRVSFRAFVGDASRLGQGAGGALDAVEMEDEVAVEAVQRGIRSRLYGGGRYAPAHERGVHQFHRLLAQALASAPPG